MRALLTDWPGLTATLSLTVRWAECDAAGIIYHGKVFDWFSEGRIAWLRGVGFPYYERLRPAGLELLVLDCQARFHERLQPGHAITLRVGATNVSPTQMEFLYRVLSDEGKIAVEGITRHVFILHGRATNLKKSAADVFSAIKRRVALSDAQSH